MDESSSHQKAKDAPSAPRRASLVPGVKLRDREKIRKIAPLIPLETVSNLPQNPAPLKRPDWIRVPLPVGGAYEKVRRTLRDNHLHSVCEEASCPNIFECFSKSTATFMIMGDICTRRCPFCDVAHGRPLPLDDLEPEHLAKAVQALALRFAVITSVDRDDLQDGGGAHFARVIAAVREKSPDTHIEILTPDFRGREARALSALKRHPPDIFNHNLETAPRLYPRTRPGASYEGSLKLLESALSLSVPTKSGLMVGVGESDEEILSTLKDLRAHGVTMLTIGQYLAPSDSHLPLVRYVTPEQFKSYEVAAYAMGFTHVASAPLVRSSYHAEAQVKGEFHTITSGLAARAK